MWTRSIVSILSLILLTATVAAAQTGPPSPGAFAKLSPGDQKIAQSLFQAQQNPNPSGRPPLTLDNIASAKGNGGWGVLYKQWKDQGYFTQKNLGQVVSKSAKPPAPPTSHTTPIKTGSGRTQTTGMGTATSAAGPTTGASGNGHANAAGHGNGSIQGGGYGASGGSLGRGAGAGHGK